VSMSSDPLAKRRLARLRVMSMPKKLKTGINRDMDIITFIDSGSSNSICSFLFFHSCNRRSAAQRTQSPSAACPSPNAPLHTGTQAPLLGDDVPVLICCSFGHFSLHSECLRDTHDRCKGVFPRWSVCSAYG
jgi:hypothetical protein